MTTRMKITLEVPEGHRFVPMVREIARTLLKHHDASPADIDRVEVILGELCSNVTRHAQSRMGCYLVTLEHHGNHAVVIVTDTGKGLNRDQVAEVGTARVDEDGSERFGGFGLQIVDGLADHVEYGKTDPQGTTVRAKMLLTPEAHRACAPGRSGPPSESGDSTGIRHRADHSLPSQPHHAPSALEAAHAAQERAEHIADALKISELRYRRLFETARDGILILDPQTGQITGANPFMEELLGYSHAEFLGKELWEIGLLRNKDASQEAFHHLQRDHYIHFENLPLETRRGERREVEFVSNLYRENGHTVIQCNIHDTTERKKMQSSLTEREAQFRTLYETMPLGILYQDTAGILTSANPAALRILGLTPGNLEEYRSTDLRWKAVHEDGTSYPSDQHPPMEALRTGQPVLGVVMGVFNPVLNETRWLRVNSVPQFHPGEARPYEVYSTFEEISKCKQEEEQIRLLAAAVENDVILITEAEPIDQPGPRVVYVNDAFTRMTGYTREEVLGKTPRILQGPGTNPETCAFLRHKLAAWKPVEVELLNYRKDGTPFWVQLNIRPVADANGWYTHWVAIQRDITERKDAERQLAAAALKNERIAETLQRSMLQTPPTGKFPGATVETLYMAAMNESDVGGDFFDAFALGTGRVAVVVGDVSGKGLVAAGRTAEVKYALRAFLHAHQSPEVALTHLNEFIYETHRQDADSGEAFIVLALAVLNTGTGEATFSSAGAEPTLILRADGTVEAVEIIGMPLGVHTGSQYTARTAHLASGETVLMATDGITEARTGRNFLGVAGLESLAIQAGPSVPLGALIQAVYDGALAFAGGALRDDACLLVARRN